MEVSSTETTKRALAVEGALALLTGTLAQKEIISAAEAIDVLEMLALSSERSAVRHKPLMEKLRQLQSLDEKHR